MREQTELAGILAGLSQKGFTVFAHYDLTVDDEVFKGICIYPKNKEAKAFLEETAGLITMQKGLVNKKKQKGK